MRRFGFGIAAAVLLVSGVSLAQPTQGGSSTNGAASATSGAQTGSGGSAVAGGDNNQAVATTSANAMTPAKGANSFTKGEAMNRIEKQGYSNVSDLNKGNDGVWRGKAQKGGNTTTVWLDYKGNVGQGQ
jgi:hypothetical protein